MRWSQDKEGIDRDFDKIKRYCKVVRALAHTQVMGRICIVFISALILYMHVAQVGQIASEKGSHYGNSSERRKYF